MAQRTPRAYRLLRGIFLAVALILAGRLIQIQFFGHDFYLRCAKRQWEKKVTIPAPRGNLYDRQGGPLAVSSESFRLSTDPNWFQKADGERQEQLLELLSPILDRSAARSAGCCWARNCSSPPWRRRPWRRRACSP